MEFEPVHPEGQGVIRGILLSFEEVEVARLLCEWGILRAKNPCKAPAIGFDNTTTARARTTFPLWVTKKF